MRLQGLIVEALDAVGLDEASLQNGKRLRFLETLKLSPRDTPATPLLDSAMRDATLGQTASVAGVIRGSDRLSSVVSQTSTIMTHKKITPAVTAVRSYIVLRMERHPSRRALMADMGRQIASQGHRTPFPIP